MANYYMTVAGAGNNSGDSWANAMALSDFKTYIEGSPTAGDIFYIAGGTYTLTSDITAGTAGTITAPFKFIGVNSGTTNEPPLLSDYAEDTSRPLFSTGSYALIFDQDYYEVSNIRCSGDPGFPFILFNVGDSGRVVNCYFNSISANGITQALDIGNYGVLSNCELEAGSGYAAKIGTDTVATHCYFHDSVYGLDNNNGRAFFSCIFDTLTQAYGTSFSRSKQFLNCTFYNCTTGIYMTSSLNNTLFLLNNTFSDCAYAFKGNFSGTAQPGYIYSDYNNWYNNTIDMSWDNGSTEDNSLKGLNELAVDPQFTDAANGDFSLQSASSLSGAGFGIQLGVG